MERTGSVLRTLAVLVLSIGLLLFSFDLQAQTVDICGRTPQIKTAILANLPAGTKCATVDSSRLASIGEISAGSKSISSLKAGDFNGLTGLENLYLDENHLTGLHKDLFEGLDSLKVLKLSWNSLNRLHKEIFDGLTSLKWLYLDHNSLTGLDENLFNGLTSLEILELHANSLFSLPDDLFDGLTNLDWLNIYDNQLTSLDKDVFDGLHSLRTLHLSDNDLNNLPEDLFDGLDNLERIDISFNDLSSLPEKLFTGLTSLKDLVLYFNSLKNLPENLFNHVTAPQSLYVWLGSNPIPCFPEAIVKNRAVRLDHSNGKKICGVFAVSLFLSPASISENGGSTTVTATLDQRPNSDFKIVVSAVSQAPVSVSDYTLNPNDTLRIAAGQMTSTGTVTITAVDNDVDAPDKTVTIQGTATSADRLIDPADVTLTITDDDAPTVTLELSPPSILESGERTTVTATLDYPSSEKTTVTISAVPQPPATSADYALSPNDTLTIAAGQTMSTGDVIITAADNAVDAPDKTITIQGMAVNAKEIMPPVDATLTITDDDLASVTALASVAVTEGRFADLPVALSSQPTADVTLAITGDAGTDLTVRPTSLVFTSTNWNIEQPVRLTAREDGDTTSDLVVLTLAASGGGYVSVTHSVAVTIIDNDTASLTAPVSAVVPEGNSSSLPIALSSRPTADVTVAITGHADTDLTLTPPALTFTATNWTTPQSFTLTAAEDTDFTNDPVALTLRASGGGYAGVKRSVAVTIIDNDTASLTAPASAVVPEGGSNGLSIALSSAPTADVTVTINGHAGSDLAVRPTSPLAFTPTNWSVPQKVTLTAAEDDDLSDDPVTLILTASGGGYVDVTHSILATIIDNDVASVTAVTSVVVPEGGSSTLPVALSSAPTAEVTFTITGHAGTDLTPTPPVLIFTPTDWNVAQMMDLTAAEDGDVTDDQVTLTLTASGGGYTGVMHSVAVTITDNDGGAITAPTSAVIPEGGTTNLSVALLSPPTAEVTLTITGHAGTDLTPARSMLTFTTTNWNVPQTVTLAAAEDGDITDDLVTLTLTASGGGYADVTHSVAVTIRDNDVAAITAPTSVVIPEGGTTDLSVALSAQPTAAVTLTIAGYMGTDLVPTPPVMIFGPTDWSVTQTVTLAAAQDGDFTNDQVMLTLTAVGGGYIGVMHAVAVTITDNDVAAVTAPTSAVVPEGGTGDLSMALSAPPIAAVTLTIAGYAGTDLTPAPSALTFTTTNWNVTQTIVLTAAEDEDFTDDRVPLTLTASGGGYAGVTHSVAVTITDNDTQAPLSLSIQDLQIVEDAAKAWLRIELNRPSQEVVTVQYATSDKTAEKGLDYTASRGIVVFDRNTTKGVIPVGILDDTIPEAEEQLMVTLSNPRNAVIARAVGTLTIVDNDGDVTLRIEDEVVEADAGMIRFTVRLSRPSSELVTVAYRTTDGTAKAGEDYRASSGVVQFAPGAVATTITVPLLLKNLDWQQETFSMHLERSTHARIAKAVAVATIRKADSVARDMLAAYTARFVRTLSVQVVEALQERFRSQADGLACGASSRAELARLWHAPSDWTPSLGELLAGCHVSEGVVAASGAVRVWGRGAFRRFNGRGGLRGDVATGLAGVDYGWNGEWVAGLLLAHSRGEGTYAVHNDSGDLASRLTGVYPYVAYQSQERGIWGTGGYGRGRAEALELEGNLGSGFGALGFWGRLGSTYPVQLTYYGDGIYADAVVKRQDVDTEVYRLRLGLEADMQIREGVRPYVKANVRQDGGSAETGLGLELGGGVRVAVPAWRLRADVQTQGLVVHTAEGFTEWGVSGSVQVGEQAQGLMLRVRPSWGTGMSLSHQQTVLDAVPTGRNRTEMELGYRLAMGQGTARSVLGATWQSGGALLRLGGELRPRDRFTLSVFGLMRAQAATRGNIGLNLQGSLRY